MLRARRCRLTPLPCRPPCDRAGRVFDKKILKENDMHSFLAAICAVLVFTATIFTLVAAPGFLSDPASTVPNRADTRDAGR